MRSTVRIDDDLMTRLRERAREEGVSLTRMLNRTLRAGLRSPARAAARRPPFRQTAFRMGEPRVGLDKALALAATLEDEEIARKLSMRK